MRMKDPHYYEVYMSHPNRSRCLSSSSHMANVKSVVLRLQSEVSIALLATMSLYSRLKQVLRLMGQEKLAIRRLSKTASALIPPSSAANEPARPFIIQQVIADTLDEGKGAAPTTSLYRKRATLLKG